MVNINLQNAGSLVIEEIMSFHDWVMIVVLSVSLLTFIILLNIFVNKLSYRRLIEGQDLECAWTVAPVLILAAIGLPSLQLLYIVDGGETAVLSIKAIGNQWYWQYDHPYHNPVESYMTSGIYRLLDVDNRVQIPAWNTIQILITAADVLHSWTVPVIGVKADAVPGRVNKAFLQPKRVGIFYGQCREICGRNHRFMPIAMECYEFNLVFTLKVRYKKVKMINISIILSVLFVLLSVAFYTQLERKTLGYLQHRKGPNKPGLMGLLIPFADAIKLVTKETQIPNRRNKIVFNVIPMLALTLPLMAWIIYPSGFPVLSMKYSTLYFLCITRVRVYAVLGAGWRRNRSFAIMGAVRSVAQSVSYEVSLSLIIIHCIVFFNYSIYQIKLRSLTTFLFLFIILLLVSSLAETNRSPFDFSEGESELVSGFNTEFGSVSFVMIFLAEYLSIMFMAAIISALFNMTAFLDFFLSCLLWAMTFIWARGTLPRFRYDQLISLAWKSYLPISLSGACLFVVC